MKNNVFRIQLIDQLGLGLLGVYALGSVMFKSDFSELHLDIFFLPFPVFIGEMLIGLCLLLLYVKNRWQPIVWTPWQKYLGFYLIAVALKALWDYAAWGPLAFRNAALFYYPVFILFGYHFFNPRYITGFLKIAAAILFIVLTTGFVRPDYFWLPAVILFFVTLCSVESVRWRWLLTALFLAGCNGQLLFTGTRTILIGVSVAVVFFVFIYLVFFLKKSRLVKMLLGGAVLVCVGAVIICFGDKNAVASLYKINDICALYAQSQKDIEIHRKDFVRQPLKTNLYYDNKQARADRAFALRNPPDKPGQSAAKHVQPQDVVAPAVVDRSDSSVVMISTAVEGQKKTAGIDIKQPVVVSIGVSDRSADIKPLPVVNERQPVQAVVDAVKMTQGKDVSPAPAIDVSAAYPSLSVSKDIQPSVEASVEVRKDKVIVKSKTPAVSADTAVFSEEADSSEHNRKRSLLTAQANMIFRILIWQDMFEEMFQERAWFGFGLGKPQRSISLEILRWAQEEWTRDGWITPHNAYLHGVYRFGLAGIVLMGCLFMSLTWMVGRFIRCQSVKGILLSTLLVYWLVTANFLVILELPHYAIFCWTMWGITLAYAGRQEREGKV